MHLYHETTTRETSMGNDEVKQLKCQIKEKSTTSGNEILGLLSAIQNKSLYFQKKSVPSLMLKQTQKVNHLHTKTSFVFTYDIEGWASEMGLQHFFHLIL